MWEELKTIIIGVPMFWIGAIALGYLGEVFETHYTWYLVFLIVISSIAWAVNKIYERNKHNKES